MKENDDGRVLAGQLVVQSTLIKKLTGQIVLSTPDRGAGIRETLVQGTWTMLSNPNMTEPEKFGAVETLEGALDMLDRIAAGARGLSHFPPHLTSPRILITLE